MKHKRVAFGILSILLSLFFLSGCKTDHNDNILYLDHDPAIEPDYSGVTIPCNIAPMNFIIKEDGTSFRLNAISSNGTQLSIQSPDGFVRFPKKSWKKLLADTQGGEIVFEILSQNEEKEWVKYNPLYLNVTNEPIDPYLCFRLLYPGYETWAKIDIVQRSTESFHKASLIENQLIDKNCVNCHSFNQYDPEKFLLHIRGSLDGTYFVEGREITRTDLKTEEMTSGAVYPAWHPGGIYVAFSSNDVAQSFHAVHDKNIEVFDLASSLILYDTRNNTMFPIIEKDTIKYMETFPEWSPDGNYLYYCRTRQVVKGSDFKDVKYDLVRKAFDQASATFGKTELVFDAFAIDKSVSFPRISPDGNYLVFTLHDYGTFSIWHREADLFLLDLQTGKIKHMSINSDETESYHSWSSNSKWLVFSSKRGDGLTARPYFAYIHSADSIGKPFVLPQKDPSLYKNMLKTYNKPEFISGKINLGPRDFLRAAKKSPIKAIGGEN